ncbi:MAG TPA: adenylate/guanylate cyclase domain-containing protein, partial [Bacteroidales bacterium]|nr:adenylate/guanylate cyclase domain-containing protein [Bacteroidales bacterium]
MSKGVSFFKTILMLDYTERVRFLTFRFPNFTIIFIHIIFWMVAFNLLSLLLHLFGGGVSKLFEVSQPGYDWFTGATAALIYGVLTGLIYVRLRDSRLNRISSVQRLLLEGMAYTIAFVITSGLVMFFWRDHRIEELNQMGVDAGRLDYVRYLTLAIFIYTFSLNFLLSFFMQMRSTFGPGVLFPLYLGKYRKPQIDHRVFMFMDLRSSTSYAEALGHLKYSELIQDCFREVNRLVPKYNAQIFQYVGDEVVITWQENRLLDYTQCLRFYFHFRKSLQDKYDYFVEKYGFVPEFKTGMHNGVVTVIEVGDIKREIAYHGDTINTAARIQSVCNKYNRSFLISRSMKNRLS